ncbi:MAG: pirin family protein, partial [Alphaproteobacteria bacterium]
MAAEPNNQRSIANIVDAIATIEGDGLEIRRAFPHAGLDHIDPFLLLDHMGPMADPTGGVPDHPHRGFETVTYLIDGAIEHRDSVGNVGVIRPGDVQWMTAGGGIVHSEMFDTEFFQSGGTLHGTQLWVNLPAHAKMMAPRYQPVAGTDMPTTQSDDGKVSVKVIA